MFTFYIACLIFGGILLTLSLIMGGGDSSVDTDHSLDTHLETDHDISLGSDLSHSLDTHSNGISDSLAGGHSGDIQFNHSGADLLHHSGGSTPEAVKFISFRYMIYFLAFFGLTGTTLSLLATSSIITFLSSLGLGSFAYYTGYKIMKYLKLTESGEAIDIYNLKGKSGKITLYTSKTQKGKILVQAQNQNIELIAKVSDTSSKEEFKYGENALIIEINNNTAYIVDADY